MSIRYFDQAELRELFQLAAEDAPCSMLSKFNAQSRLAMGSSGKPSFLSRHKQVVGVASHDMLYRSTTSHATVDLTESTNTAASETPFSRLPYARAPTRKITTNEANCLSIVESPTLKPLGDGMNRTRQNREKAKVLHAQEGGGGSSQKMASVEEVLSSVDFLVSNRMNDRAMQAMLDLVEKENHLLQGQLKLKVHEKLSEIGSKLGWLQL